ncbi:MAG TPA: hypothetical protein VKZ18_01490, partial [Polyangia bacterium]|nr:hypothetical protein [Polyangia bacterium]
MKMTKRQTAVLGIALTGGLLLGCKKSESLVVAEVSAADSSAASVSSVTIAVGSTNEMFRVAGG